MLWDPGGCSWPSSAGESQGLGPGAAAQEYVSTLLELPVLSLSIGKGKNSSRFRLPIQSKTSRLCCSKYLPGSNTLDSFHPRTKVWLEERKGMEKPNPASLQLEGGKDRSRVQSQYVNKGPTWKALEEYKDIPGQKIQQRWETQWQEFLKTLQSPSSSWGSLPPAEETPWKDAKAFLASFEQVAKACRWPKEEWAAQLLPALSGEAEQAFLSLEARDRKDYGKVKVAILRAEALRMELQRQHFRQFCCQEVEDPRRVYSQVQELCSRWLKPERRSKEQILELLVLEQFLASLPQDLQGWVRGAGPETCSQAVALAEDFLLKRQQEASSAKWQGPSQEVCVGSLETEGKSPDVAQGKIYEELKPVKDGEIPLLVFAGAGIKGPSPSISVLPPEGQVKTEDGLGEGLMDCRVFLHRVEQTLSQADQQTTFWQVLQEEEGGSAQAFGEEKSISLKVEVSQHGGDELEEGPGAAPLVNQGNGPLMAETCEQRSDEIGCWNEMKLSQQVELLPAEASQRSLYMPSDGHRMGYHLRGQELKKLVETERKHTKSVVIGIIGGDTNVSDGFAALNPRKKDAECPEDGERCKSHRQSLQRSQNLPTGRKPHKCSQCGKGFAHGKTLKMHQKIHSGEKPYECSQCGKCFTQRSHLKTHQRIHTGEKPYECSQCGECFTLRCSLKTHQILHTGEKPHKCFQCGKSFAQRKILKMHLIIHTGEKPYKCSYCGKCFTQRCNLKTHQRVHTGEKPYECSQCGKCFNLRHSLKNHQRIHTRDTL